MGDRVAVLKDGLLQQVDIAAQHVRPPGQPLRRRLHRLPRDEPRRGADHRRRREVRQHASSRSQREALTAAADKGDTHGHRRCPPRALRHRRRRRGAKSLSKDDAPAGLAVTVNVVEELGADGYVYGTAEVGGEHKDLVVRVGGRAGPGEGRRAARRAAPGRDPRLLHLHRRAPQRLTSPGRRAHDPERTCTALGFVRRAPHAAAGPSRLPTNTPADRPFRAACVNTDSKRPVEPSLGGD